ncbi:hypothetical protein [uncultured Microbacterium sp.]|uniref:hypothetical protein n=1 Tax=uncultured Microbacterium sp. TaxID=191216 RepID=UPI0028D64481|nr:hypothetical protein [uncultured Microbacterium sp.]
MSFKFEFDEKALKRELARQAQPEMDRIAREMTREMERLRGLPIDQIKPALQRLFARDGGSITEPELSEYAQMIHDGTRIEFKANRIGW